MSNVIRADIVASVSELKTNPMATVRSAEGRPLAILNRNQPVFYCIPADLYEDIMEMLDDVELGKIIAERAGEREITVNISEL